MKKSERPAIPLVTLLIPLLILSVLSVVLFSRYASDAMDVNSSSKLDETQNQFSFLFQDLKKLSNYIGNDADSVNALRSILAGKRQISLESFQSYNFINHILVTSLASDDKRIPIKQSIYLYFPNEQNRFLTSDRGLVHPEEYYDTSWLSWTKNLSDPFYGTEATEIQPYPYAKNISIVRIFSLLPFTGRELGSGLIVLNINQEYLEQNIYPSILVYSGDQCIVNTTLDSEQIRAFAADSGDKGRIKIGGIHYLATKRFDPAYNLTYVNLEDARQLYGFPLLIIAFTIILCLVVITTGGVFMFRENQRQQQNVDHLLALFKQAQSREKIDFPKTHPEGRYETLVNNIVSNFIENEYLKVQLSERIYKTRMLELLALHNQINPHFLFNTLDAINWRILASYGHDSPAVSMMQDLAVLLKYSFAGSNKVTLLEELDCIKTYVHLQKLRSRNGIEFIEDIDLEVVNAEIPKMILQPIIENSIYHSRKSIRITLTITQKWIADERVVIIQIADNGAGIDSKILEELRNKILESPSEDEVVSSNHIGLVNTYRRIVLFFGEKQCTCTLESIPNSVTSVTFTFPYRSFPQKDEYSVDAADRSNRIDSV